MKFKVTIELEDVEALGNFVTMVGGGMPLAIQPVQPVTAPAVIAEPVTAPAVAEVVEPKKRAKKEAVKVEPVGQEVESVHDVSKLREVVSPSAPVLTTPEALPPVSIDLVRKRLTDYAESRGTVEAKKLLLKYGKPNLSSLSPAEVADINLEITRAESGYDL